jgi:hypothetical protein
MSKIRHTLVGALACLIAITSAANSEGLRSRITYLSKAQAAVAIVDDSMEPYFEQLQAMEMAAKTGAPVTGATIEAQRIRCRARYQAGVLEFTEAEQAAIRFYIDKVSPVLIKDYPLVGNMPWSFLKVSDSIEGGLPHTRDRHIILSKSMCEQMAMVQQKQTNPMAHIGMLQLLVHEQFHVFQRTHPGLCDSLYTGLWGFEKADAVPECKWLSTCHLANPDAVNCPWVLPIKKGVTTRYLWPLVVFSEGPALKRMPADFRMVAISLTKRENRFALQVDGAGNPVLQDLRLAPEFRALFPLSTNIYHPDEASADMFGMIVIWDSFLPANAVPTEKRRGVEKHLTSLRQWFSENCANQLGCQVDGPKPASDA